MTKGGCISAKDHNPSYIIVLIWIFLDLQWCLCLISNLFWFYIWLKPQAQHFISDFTFMYIINILIKIICHLIGVHDAYFLLKRVYVLLKFGTPGLDQREIEQWATLCRVHEFPFKGGWGRRSTRKADHLPFLVRLPKGATPCLPKVRFKMGLNSVNLLLLIPYYSGGDGGSFSLFR